MKFSSFKNWLFERKAETLEYGCLMLGADVPDWKEKISIVDKEDIYEKNGDYGYEKEPHVTVMYGFHEDQIDLKEVYREAEKLKPVNVSIDTISFFECDEYDVVKFDVPVTSELKTYRKTFMKFPNTQTYNKYEPHITIAYVLPSKGKQYIQTVKPFNVEFNVVIYSSPKGIKKRFNLK
jgi:hypothetical protein